MWTQYPGESCWKEIDDVMMSETVRLKSLIGRSPSIELCGRNSESTKLQSIRSSKYRRFRIQRYESIRCRHLFRRLPWLTVSSHHSCSCRRSSQRETKEEKGQKGEHAVGDGLMKLQDDRDKIAGCSSSGHEGQGPLTFKLDGRT